MNSSFIIDQLNNKYSGKKIIFNKPANPTEIICEIEPTEDHPQYSKIIAVIDQSIPHYHRHLTETYTVINGQLELHIDNQIIQLKPGDEYTIKPNQIHFAFGKSTWIECYSKPGWKIKDHILVDK
jgi:mannose-6-phosphate isomerase-like protein (cupin superfamily)